MCSHPRRPKVPVLYEGVNFIGQKKHGLCKHVGVLALISQNVCVAVGMGRPLVDRMSLQENVLAGLC